MDKYKYGADPELFFAYPNSVLFPEYNKDLPFVLPAYFTGMPIIGGDFKHPVYVQNDVFRIVGDGVAFEINLAKPHAKAEDLYIAVQKAKEELAFLAERFGCFLWSKPVINFDYIKYQDKEKNPESYQFWSLIFGCDPDEDVFNVDWLCSVLDAGRHPFRYGGGHLHLSSKKAWENHLVFTKLMAVTVGNFCVANSTCPEVEVERAKYYGKPGKMRQQQYNSNTFGIEYRTPSNEWLNWPIDKFNRMMALADRCVGLLDTPAKALEILDAFADKTVDAITTFNQKLSSEILVQIGE